MLFGLRFIFDVLKADAALLAEDDIWFSRDFFEFAQ